MACTAGNLDPVIAKVKKVYVNAHLIICADNDLAQNGRNTGVLAATACKEKFACDVIIPNFDNIITDENLSDFNDIHKHLGLDAVTNILKIEITKLQENKTLGLTNQIVLDHYAKWNYELIAEIKHTGKLEVNGIDGGIAYLSDNEPVFLAKLLKQATNYEIDLKYFRLDSLNTIHNLEL
jgi:phage/plasmid primase-like uncharacterized protein